MVEKEKKIKKGQEKTVTSGEHINDLIHYLDWSGRDSTKENSELIRKADIQSGWQVLDVGSGTGYLSIPIAKEVKPDGCVYCVDREHLVQDVLIKKAKELKLEDFIKTICIDEFLLPFNDNYFDAVLSAYMLHESGDLAPAVLEEMFRVLKPNHKIVIADFRYIENDQRCGEIENWFKQQFKGDENEIHLRFSIKDLEVMLLEVGFRDVRVSPWLDFQMNAEAVK